MTDNNNEMLHDEEEMVVVMTDEEGNEFYYREEIVIPVGDKRFAVLVSIEECECSDTEECEDEADVFIARIDVDENGEEVYVDPTDEEFEEVRAAYEKLMDEEEAE